MQEITNRQYLIDIQNLKKYPEFYALKKHFEEFCAKLDSLEDIDLENLSRLTINEEIYGRRWASMKLKDELSSLGLVDKAKPKITDKTGE